MDAVRILHISDVHIGAPFRFLGVRGADQRAALRDALRRAVDLARDGGYHALLIAGDLFDAAFDVSDADVSFVADCLACAGPGCRVVVLPGGHDCYAPGSVYERERGRLEAGGNVTILTPARRVVDAPELSLAVHGTALVSNLPPADVFTALAPAAGRRWNVAMAHCSIAGSGPGLDPGETPVRLEDLPPGFDYVALGHWHSCRVLRDRDPAAAYSGSPEIVARDQRGAGSALSVILSEAGVAIEPVGIGRRRIETASIDCTGLRSAEELARSVLAAAPPDPDVILELSLAGLVGVDSALEPGRLPPGLEERYFSVRVAGRGPARELARDELLAVPEETVAGAFVRRMLERIDGAEGETRELYEEALQLGYQLFKGRDLIG
jgi:exonuclease SbcD